MKQVLSVQDLSCLGKCSLSVAMPVLSAMGCACTPLPTAILSTHTGFPAPHVRSLTEDIAQTCDHWQRIGARFDGISVGYLSDPAQAAAVEQVLEAFPAPVVLDPVLGDQGKCYTGIGADHVAAVKQLCAKATVLLPNITEACLLTGIPYRQTTDAGWYAALLAATAALGAEKVILTGVSLSEGKTGFVGTEGISYQTHTLPGSFHGTGDLFAAVFTGSFVQGRDLAASAALAAGFVERVIRATGEPTPFGVNFESQLPWLWQQLI